MLKILALIGLAILVAVLVGRLVRDVPRGPEDDVVRLSAQDQPTASPQSSAGETAEDSELRELDLAVWDCVDKPEGSAQQQDVKERNQMKNRLPVNLSLFNVEPLDTANFLKTVREYDSRLQSKRRSEMTPAQKDEVKRYENQIVSLTGWVVIAYAGRAESANCRDDIFHDWHLEIFAEPSDHAPREGDPTPIICEITPRTERVIYDDGARIQSLTGFFRSRDVSYQATGHGAQRVRVTGYLMWDDDHNGSADVGSTVQRFSNNGFHHPWRSTAWEIHPVMRVELLE